MSIERGGCDENVLPSTSYSSLWGIPTFIQRAPKVKNAFK